MSFEEIEAHRLLENQRMNLFLREQRGTVPWRGSRTHDNELVVPRPVHLGQGVARHYWNGPAVRHPGYVRVRTTPPNGLHHRVLESPSTEIYGWDDVRIVEEAD